MPPADAGVRAQIDAQAAAQGWPALHAALARVDAPTAARLAPHDAQRIQRALEVFRLTGRPLSAHHATKGIAAYPDWMRATTLFSLEPQDRGWLHARIAQRFGQMLDAGLLDEVLALRARGDLSPQMPSMRCVGYRQAWAWLDAQAAGRPLPLAQLRDSGIAATRQLAKRQLTWLRGMPRRHVVACDAPDAQARLLAAVRAAG